MFPLLLFLSLTCFVCVHSWFAGIVAFSLVVPFYHEYGVSICHCLLSPHAIGHLPVCGSTNANTLMASLKVTKMLFLYINTENNLETLCEPPMQNLSTVPQILF